MVAIARILTVKRAALSVDVSWDSSAISYLSVIEVNVGIICACLITLRPLLSTMFPSMGLKSSYGRAGYYGADRGGTAAGPGGTKKSSRDTMTHADHGIYGLADLEVTKVLNASQEGLTSTAYFEPVHFSGASGHRMSTSITAGGPRLSARMGDDRVPIERIKTRAGDIMVTRETTIREETRAISPEARHYLDKEDWRWLAALSKETTGESFSTAVGEAQIPA